MRELTMSDIEMVDKGRHYYESRRAAAPKSVPAPRIVTAPKRTAASVMAQAAQPQRRMPALRTKPSRSRFRLRRFATA